MEKEIVNKEEIPRFYDRFSKQQVKTGINLRHYFIFNQLVASGLKKSHSVLEVGCGIGTLTWLIARFLKKGALTGVDISPENIEIARKRLERFRNCNFAVSDMSDFAPQKRYDYIILADVIEHIPLEDHPRLFHTLSELMHSRSVIFINVPHPKSIEFYQRTDPSKLQIVDQPVYAFRLMQNAENSGLLLKKYSAYSLFHDPEDYAMVIFTKTGDFDFTPRKKPAIIVRKLIQRILFHWNNIF